VQAKNLTSQREEFTKEKAELGTKFNELKAKLDEKEDELT